MICQQQRVSSQHAQSALPDHDMLAVLHFMVDKLLTGSALPLTPRAILYDTLQEMCRGDQRARRQIVHLDTEIRALATCWTTSKGWPKFLMLLPNWAPSGPLREGTLPLTFHPKPTLKQLLEHRYCGVLPGSAGALVSGWHDFLKASRDCLVYTAVLVLKEPCSPCVASHWY